MLVEVFKISSRFAARVSREPLGRTLEGIRSRMDDPQEVFVYRYERLQTLLKGGPEGQLLDVALILRQLLMDKVPLVDVVNQSHRLQIRFKVSESASEIAASSSMPGAKSTFVFVGTTWPPFAPLTDLKRDAFLSFDILFLDGVGINVGQVIRFCANKLGGVHYDAEVDDPADLSLRALNNQFSLGGASTALASLRLIGSTTIEALNELYDVVLKTRGSTSRMGTP